MSGSRLIIVVNFPQSPSLLPVCVYTRLSRACTKKSLLSSFARKFFLLISRPCRHPRFSADKSHDTSPSNNWCKIPSWTFSPSCVGHPAAARFLCATLRCWPACLNLLNVQWLMMLLQKSNSNFPADLPRCSRQRRHSLDDRLRRLHTGCVLLCLFAQVNERLRQPCAR